ncbi:hypothetical protein [Succinivibrio dextrinosolvens]|nr:hypothetical protein [Succinivibrio dextrinosolvens]
MLKSMVGYAGYIDSARLSARIILPIISTLPKVNTVTIILMTPSI